VLNADDPVGAAWAEALAPRLPGRVLTFGLGPGRAVRPQAYESSLGGIRLEAETPVGRVALASPLTGEHNVMNLLGAVGVGAALGLPPDAIARALRGVSSVPGRFERVDAGQEFLVVVDYAHTPDALRRVLETAPRLADRLWITSDNPRSEDPDAIIEEIARGVTPPPREGQSRLPDRAEAIRAAIDWARQGDTVVIAGKGHETYQIIGERVLPFDDRAVARQLLAERVRRAACGEAPA
jgi:UDP-N-acetylmuramoyl-L-alanyl-D-glutamate--2,6-diaminopimelate ligase